MKENTKVSQDKKVPVDATTEKTKNNASNKEENRNVTREDSSKDGANTKAPKTQEKVKSTSGR